MIRVALSALLASACTFEPGTGFGTLESTSLSVELRPGAARDLGNRTVLSDQGYHVRLDSARLAVGDLVLSELSGGDGVVDFDPADPPAGYSLCHAGHCHADDGRLVSYEAIEAELSGGSAAFVPVAVLPVAAVLDLWSDAPSRLPPRELPRTTLKRLSIELSELELSGSVTAGALSGSEVPLAVRLPLSAGFEKRLARKIGRDQPGELALDVQVSISARLVDGLDFAAEAAAGAITLDDPEHPLAVELVESLLASEVDVTFD